ncbi:winged helix-turn-helix domain-containing protein, partial [Bacillus licheniformis]
MDITPFLSRSGSEPLYQQLYAFFKRSIHSGYIKPGTKLPSKRMLAKHLNISLTTVEHAYEQLAAEGYLLSKPRKGWYAAEAEGDFAQAAPPPAEKEMEEHET